MAAGWFDPAELSNGNTPIIFEIVLNIDGNRISARKVISASENIFVNVTIRRPTPEEAVLVDEAAAKVCAEAANAAEPFIN
jgi:hypothetical protein